jgi:AcrR family transcriptional regulator
MAQAVKSSKVKGDAAAPAARRPRADAVRNRALIVDAATDAFRELGLDASVAEIARRAGVGTGTLFRNFPTKDDLIYAVVEQRMDGWTATAEQALDEPDAEKAFKTFMYAAADAQMQDRGFSEAMKKHIIDEPELMECKGVAMDLTQKVLKRAQDAGAVRKDVTFEDLGYIINASVSSDPLPGADNELLHKRYLEIMLAGLKPAADSTLAT